MQGRTTDFLEVLIANQQTNHSSFAFQELMHAIGVLDPEHGRSRAVIDAIRTLILSTPAHRTFVPDADVLGRAALLSGMICRLQIYAGDYRLRALLDCVLFLQAQKLGFSVLTANVDDFDILLQFVAGGHSALLSTAITSKRATARKRHHVLPTSSVASCHVPDRAVSA
jgi:hypothetical protein